MDLLDENRSLIHSGKLLRQPDSGLEWNGWSELFVLLFDNYRSFICHPNSMVYADCAISRFNETQGTGWCNDVLREQKGKYLRARHSISS